MAKIFDDAKQNENDKIKACLECGEAQTTDGASGEVDVENTNNGEGGGDNAPQHADNDINEQKIGKFKNPQELLLAYVELEKEFTRRSQRLKELESGKRSLKDEGDFKLAVDKFFNEIPAAKAFAKDIANELLNNPELREDENCLNVALLKVLTDKFRTPEQLMSDGQFLNDYVFSSEEVRNAIIESYLDGVRKGVPPYTLRGGGMQCVAPKVKPKTIEEAGFMFFKNNK